MYGFTRALDPQLTLSYHTQGRVIYWQYDGYDVPGSKAIAERFAAASGYAVAETPYASGHAGLQGLVPSGLPPPRLHDRGGQR